MAQAPSAQDLKAAMKAMWMAGNFGVIAKMNQDWAEHFIERLGIKPGMQVLDVGCGTGNQAIPAARTGAHVTGVDIATNLLEQARSRAQAEGLKIDFIEGDAQELPFGDSHFDVVYSMFGAMFAPEVDRVTTEFARVCKPGGLVAMGNWTPDSVAGQLFKVSGKYAPPPPGMQPPSLWGVDDIVRQRFGSAFEIRTRKQVESAYFDLPPSEVVELFSQWFGPTKMTLARLDPESQVHFKAEMTKIFESVNRHPNGGTEHDAEYLEVYARKR